MVSAKKMVGGEAGGFHLPAWGDYLKGGWEREDEADGYGMSRRETTISVQGSTNSLR